MSILIGLYGRERDVYAEAIYPFFEQVLQRYALDVRDIELEIKERFEHPSFRTFKKKIENGKFSKLTSLSLYCHPRAAEPSQATDLLEYATAVEHWMGWSCAIHLDQMTTLDDAGSLLDGFPSHPTIRYGFATIATSEQAGGVVSSGRGDVNIRNNEFYFGLGHHLVDQMRDVRELNVLSSDHLERLIDGRTLRQWIDTGRHGSLAPFRDGAWIWRPDPSRIDEYRELLETEGVLLPPYTADRQAALVALAQSHAAAEEKAPRSAQRSEMDKRDNLVAKMKAAAPKLASVSLEEFFEGNRDPGSFWPNLPEPVAPDDAFARLLRIRERDDVHDVRIILTQFDNGEDEWPFSDTVIFVTSLGLRALKRCLGRDAKPDEIGEAGSVADDATPALHIPTGMKVYAAWWD